MDLLISLSTLALTVGINKENYGFPKIAAKINNRTTQNLLQTPAINLLAWIEVILYGACGNYVREKLQKLWLLACKIWYSYINFLYISLFTGFNQIQHSPGDLQTVLK